MAYRSSTTNTGTSATPATAVPAGVAADDIVILTASIDAVADAFDPADWPTGFTELAESGTSFDGQRSAVGWKRLTGADTGSYTFGSLGGASGWVCQAYAFSGRDTGNPPVATSNLSNAGNASPVSVSATGVTALTGDDLIWISTPDVSATGIGSGHTAPSGYTIRQDGELTFTNLAGATKDNSASGATGTVTGTFALTSGTAAWVAFLVRIPAAGGATPVTVTPSAATVAFTATASAQAATAVTPAPSSTVFSAAAAATAQTAVAPAAATAAFTAAASVSTAAPVDLGTVTAAAVFTTATAPTATAVVTPSSADTAFSATTAVTASPVVAGSAATSFAATAAAVAPTVVVPAAASSVYGASAVVTTPGTPTASSRLPLIGVGT